MKSIFKSKTFWLNAIAGILAILTMINPELLTSLGLGADAEKKILTGVGFITAIANVVLRLFTTGPVGINPPKPTENGQPS